MASLTAGSTSDSYSPELATAFPRIRIEPPRGWFELRLHEVWQYQELLYFLVWRNIKVRYKQTVIGVAWVVLRGRLWCRQPIARVPPPRTRRKWPEQRWPERTRVGGGSERCRVGDVQLSKPRGLRAIPQGRGHRFRRSEGGGVDALLHSLRKVVLPAIASGHGLEVLKSAVVTSGSLF